MAPSITKGRRCFSVRSTKPGTSGPLPFSQGLSPFTAILHYASQQSGILSICQVPLGIPLGSVQWKRASSPVEAGPSGFLSHSDMDLVVCLQFQTGSQVSTCVKECNSAFLSSCKRVFRPPVELNWGPGAFLEFSPGVSVLPSCCELILRVPCESVQGNQALYRVDGEL